MQLSELTDDGRYRVARSPGVAYWFDKPQTEPDEDTEWSGIENETGMALMVMVGDDRRHVVDPADITLIKRSEYCSDCGQIGCTWGAQEDTDVTD